MSIEPLINMSVQITLQSKTMGDKEFYDFNWLILQNGFFWLISFLRHYLRNFFFCMQVRGMGMESPELLLLVENCPKGAETLVTRVIHILTDKSKTLYYFLSWSIIDYMTIFNENYFRSILLVDILFPGHIIRKEGLESLTRTGHI